MARPTIYNKKIALEICSRIAKGESVIYSLSDESGVRYIGQTNNPRKRFGQHCSYAQNIGNRPLQKWIRVLLDSGDKPIFSIIEYTEYPDKRERFWIKKYRNKGIKLLNITDGGFDYKYLNKVKKEKLWGNTLSPTQKILKTIREIIKMHRERGNNKDIEYFEEMYKKAVDIIKVFGRDKINNLLWKKYEQKTST